MKPSRSMWGNCKQRVLSKRYRRGKENGSLSSTSTFMGITFPLTEMGVHQPATALGCSASSSCASMRLPLRATKKSDNSFIAASRYLPKVRVILPKSVCPLFVYGARGSRVGDSVGRSEGGLGFYQGVKKVCIEDFSPCLQRLFLGAIVVKCDLEL